MFRKVNVGRGVSSGDWEYIEGSGSLRSLAETGFQFEEHLNPRENPFKKLRIPKWIHEFDDTLPDYGEIQIRGL